jgi:hypothetical protein
MDTLDTAITAGYEEKKTRFIPILVTDATHTVVTPCPEDLRHLC